MKVVFFVFVSDNYYEPIGTPKLLNSFKHFHPDIPFKVFKQSEVEKVFSNHNTTWDLATPTFAKLLTPDYDLVVGMGADQIITAPLDEVLADNYEIGAPLNNNNWDSDITYKNIDRNHYVNASLVASRRKDFWDNWEALNKKDPNTPFKEQDTLNEEFWSEKYFAKVFDWPGSNLIYGTQLRYKWDEMYMEGEKLMYNGKQVKVIHEAGGHRLPKLCYDNWNLKPEVKSYLDKLTL